MAMYRIIRKDKSLPSTLVLSLINARIWADANYPPLPDDETGRVRFKHMIPYLSTHPDLEGKVRHIPKNELEKPNEGKNPNGGMLAFILLGNQICQMGMHEFLIQAISMAVKEGKIPTNHLEAGKRWEERLFPRESIMGVIIQAANDMWKDKVASWAEEQ